MELRLSGLVVEHHSRLKVYNQIYAAIFDLDWVEQTLVNLRPYADALSAWTNSNRQDNDQLLRGEALLNAQAWAVDKSLGNQDYHFLAASLTLDKQITLDAKQEADDLITEAHRKANQIIYFAWVVFAIALIVIGAVGLLAGRTYYQVIFAR